MRPGPVWEGRGKGHCRRVEPFRACLALQSQPHQPTGWPSPWASGSSKHGHGVGTLETAPENTCGSHQASPAQRPSVNNLLLLTKHPPLPSRGALPGPAQKTWLGPRVRLEPPCTAAALLVVKCVKRCHPRCPALPRVRGGFMQLTEPESRMVVARAWGGRCWLNLQTSS